MLYRGPALAQLRILKQEMQLGGLKIGTRTVNLGNGVTCFCKICFNIEEVYIHVPVKPDESTVSITGIILHPRSGGIVSIPFREYIYTDFGSVYQIKRITRGVVGGWSQGKTVLTSWYPFPLDDADNASFFWGRQVDSKKGASEVSRFTMPGKYGNLYWTNDAAWDPTTKIWNKPFLCLSWRGTPTRHFRLPSSINLPGLSIVERVVSGLMTGDIPDHTAFGTCLYQGGAILSYAPRYSWPAGESLDRCLILGAMQNSSGAIFIVTQNDHYGKPSGAGGFFIGVWSNVLSISTSNIRVDGWELLLEVAHTRMGVPWFGNSSGTAFVCGNGDSVTISFTAGKPPTISANYTAYVQTSGTRTESLTGEHRYNVAYAISASGLNYFYGYNKDTKVSSIASLSFSAVSVQGSGSWGTTTTSIGNPNITGGNVTAYTDTSIDTYPTFQYCYVTSTATAEDLTTLRHLTGYDAEQNYSVSGGGEACIGIDWLGQPTSPYAKGTVKGVRGTGQLTTWEGTLPGSKHTIATDFIINVCGVSIPIIKTTRQWENKRTPHSSIEAETAGFVKGWIKESCSITRSTLHYLDERYGVCLYKTTVDVIDLPEIQSSEVSHFMAYGAMQRSATVVLKRDDYTATTTETWYLIVDGIQSTLTTSTLEIFPFGEPMNSTEYDYEDVVEVFTLPKIAASSAAQEGEAAQVFGSYEDGYDNSFGEQAQADGGLDYFYPAWCRSLQEDPFWKEIAAARYGFTMPGMTVEASGTSTYTPPEVIVEPIPSGSFARHPVLGDLYQFLISKFDGTDIVISSANINAKIDAALAKNNLATHDTTLYYPISII